MKRNEFRGEPKFYSGQVEDSVLRLINELWFTSNTHSVYGPVEPIIYNGSSYRIDLTSSDSIINSIEYIPRYAPTNIQRLDKQLDRIVNWSKKEVPPFSLEPFIERLAKTVTPPPPPDLPPPVIRERR